MSNTDKWVEEILEAVQEVENSRYEDCEEISFDNSRYSESYQESLLAYVY